MTTSNRSEFPVVHAVRPRPVGASATPKRLSLKRLSSKRLSSNGFSSVLAVTVLLGLALCLTACGPLGLDGAGSGADVTLPPSDEDNVVAATLGGRSVPISEVEAYMQRAFIEELRKQPKNEIFEARQKAVRDMVRQQIVDKEMAARGVSEEELLESLVAEVPAPSVDDVTAWYKQNQSQLRGARLEDVSPQIMQLLERERQSRAVGEFMDTKLAALDFEFVLQPPREELEATRLVRGNEAAPITLMAYSDYQCPYCIRSEPVLAEVLRRYPEQVRVIHRHFPLDSIHPFARPAAEASMCADEQGKFWQYHDGIFARGGKLTAESFGEIGAEIGLDNEALGACIAERRYADFVQQDFDSGREAGVTGTPAFFVNGIFLKGARDADQLSAVIDEELARVN